MYFFDNNSFIMNCVLQYLIKATTSKSRQNKTCIICKIRKRKTTAFQPSSQISVYKKILSATVFLFTRAMSQTNMLAYSLGDCRDNQRNSQSVFRLVYCQQQSNCIDSIGYHISNFLLTHHLHFP